jgi:hypothetical protein
MSRWAPPKRYKTPVWCKRAPNRNLMSKAEYQRIRLNAARIPQKELAQLMGRSIGFINKAVKFLQSEFGAEFESFDDVPRKTVESDYNAERMMELSERIG